MLFGNFSRSEGFLKAFITPCICFFNLIGFPLVPGNNVDSSVRCSWIESINCIAPFFSAPKRIDVGSPFLILQNRVKAVSILSNTEGLLFIIASWTAYSKQIPQSPSPSLYNRDNINKDILSYPPTSSTISRFNEYKIPRNIGIETENKASTSELTGLFCLYFTKSIILLSSIFSISSFILPLFFIFDNKK